MQAGGTDGCVKRWPVFEGTVQEVADHKSDIGCCMSAVGVRNHVSGNINAHVLLNLFFVREEQGITGSAPDIQQCALGGANDSNSFKQRLCRFLEVR